MKMIYVRGGNVWATAQWERPVEQELADWTRKAVEQTGRMRRFKQQTPLQVPHDLQVRLGLSTDRVTLTVNGRVELSSVERAEPLCVLESL